MKRRTSLRRESPPKTILNASREKVIMEAESNKRGNPPNTIDTEQRGATDFLKGNCIWVFKWLNYV
jgi:hypothetical protein